MGIYDEALRDFADVYLRLSRVDDGPGTLTRAEGSDESGTVHVAVGRDGVPEAIRVDQGWQRAVDADGFADALTGAAAAARLHARADNEPGDWFDRTARTLTGEAPDRLGDRASSIEAVFAPGGRGRAPESFLADARRYADAADGRLDRSRLATGTAASGRLALGLEPSGSLSCEVDPDWLARQDAEGLTESLNRALAAARAELYKDPPGRHP